MRCVAERADISGRADSFLRRPRILRQFIQIVALLRFLRRQREVRIHLWNYFAALLLKICDVAARLALWQGEARFVRLPLAAAP